MYILYILFMLIMIFVVGHLESKSTTPTKDSFIPIKILETVV
jgi:hypothetical protein